MTDSNEHVTYQGMARNFTETCRSVSAAMIEATDLINSVQWPKPATDWGRQTKAARTDAWIRGYQARRRAW